MVAFATRWSSWKDPAKKLSGVGKAIVEKTVEFLQTGRIGTLEKYEALIISGESTSTNQGPTSGKGARTGTGKGAGGAAVTKAAPVAGGAGAAGTATTSKKTSGSGAAGTSTTSKKTSGSGAAQSMKMNSKKTSGSGAAQSMKKVVKKD